MDIWRYHPRHEPPRPLVDDRAPPAARGEAGARSGMAAVGHLARRPGHRPGPRHRPAARGAGERGDRSSSSTASAAARRATTCAAAPAAAEAAGLSCLRLNLRGSDRQGEDFYHAGLTADLHAALASEELRATGGSTCSATRWAGSGPAPRDRGGGPPRGRRGRDLLAARPRAPRQEIDAPSRWVYRRYLLDGLVSIYAAVAARRPVPFRSRRPPASAPCASGTTASWPPATASPTPRTTTPGRAWPRDSRSCVCPPCCSTPKGIRWSRPAPSAPPSVPAPRLEVRWMKGGGHVAFPRKPGCGATGWDRVAAGAVRRRSPPSPRPSSPSLPPFHREKAPPPGLRSEISRLERKISPPLPGDGREAGREGVGGVRVFPYCPAQ